MLCDACLEQFFGSRNLSEDEIKDFIKFKKFRQNIEFKNLDLNLKKIVSKKTD